MPNVPTMSALLRFSTFVCVHACLCEISSGITQALQVPPKNNPTLIFSLLINGAALYEI